MGKGMFVNGKFWLLVRFEGFSGAAGLKARGLCEDALKKASQLLYEATSGQLQVEKYYRVGSTADADFLVKNCNDTCRGPYCGLRQEGATACLYAVPLSSGYGRLKVLHEMGHYLFNLYDEHWDINHAPGARCCYPGAPEYRDYAIGHVCIMEKTEDSNIFRFCNALTHQTVFPNQNQEPPSEHQEKIGHSCLEHLHKNYCLGYERPTALHDGFLPLCRTRPDLVCGSNTPGAAVGLPTSPPYKDPVFIDLPAKDYKIYLQDWSRSQPPAMAAGIRSAGHFWINQMVLTGDEVALVAFNDKQEVLHPLGTIESQHQANYILEKLSALEPAGLTDLEGALAAAIRQFREKERVSDQSLLLVTDGVHNTGKLSVARLTELLTQIYLAGFSCHTLAVGPYADAALMQHVASGTGGYFTHLEVQPDTPQTQLDVQNAIMSHTALKGWGWGNLPVEEIPAQEQPVPYKPSAYLRQTLGDWGRPHDWQWRRTSVDLGAGSAVFLVSFLAGDEVRFFLRRPDGVIVEPGMDKGVSLTAPARAPYAFFAVQEPQPGEWVLFLARPLESREKPVTFMAFVDHAEVFAGLDLKNCLYQVKRPVTIRAFATYVGEALADMTAPVVRVRREPDLIGDPWESVVLEPTLSHAHEPGHHQGVFEGVVHRYLPGSYTVEATFTYQGKLGPAFRRQVTRQFHVGPLSPGQDVEHGLRGLIISGDLIRTGGR